ncbi:hypothetical protein GQ457_05G031090 [Hibiscus cannabinus]
MFSFMPPVTFLVSARVIRPVRHLASTSVSPPIRHLALASDPRYRYPRVSTGTQGSDTLNHIYFTWEYRYPRHEYRYPLHQKGSNGWKMSPTAPNNSQRSPTARYTIETIKQASKHQEKTNASLITIHMMKICLRA